MPADLLARLDLDLLYPPFLERVLDVLHACRKRGADYWGISGLRTFQEQNQLFAQGRTTPGAVVTNARGGQSAHNFGFAIDLSRDKNAQRTGLQPDWTTGAYDILGAESAKSGLVWGGAWKFKDVPHVQVPKLISAQDLRPYRIIYENTPGNTLDRLRACWKAANDLLEWMDN